jgi:phosphate/sulfate permease
MQWLQDPWVVGIGGGVVSGLLVFFITKWLFSNQSKRETEQKIAAANREVVLAVRQGIPQDTVPTSQVINALIKATARKHGIRPEELYGPAEVAQDLIKEVMDSSFIGADTKEAYCKRLAELDEPKHGAEPQTGEDTKRRQRDRSQNALLSITLAFTAAAMSATFAAVFKKTQDSLPDLSTSSTILSTIFVPVVVILAAATVSLAVLTIIRRERRLRDERRRDELPRDERLRKSDGGVE